MDEVDVAIVGARPAGASLGIRLARAGLRVCLLDRARFPSDVPSTHGIQPAGVRVLTDLGLADRLTKLSAPITRATMQLDDARIEVDDVVALRGAPMLNLRRRTLDTVLVEEAAASGADVRTGTAVTGLRWEAGRVRGVRTASGDLSARLVVGADGHASSVARWVGAREHGRRTPGRIFLWTYLEGAPAPRDHLWIGKVGDHGYLGSPTDDGLFLLAVAPSVSGRTAVLADPGGTVERALPGWPELAGQVDGARRVGPVRSMPEWPCFFRTASGPGWVLVGDAGHVKDPTPGQGISDALRQSTELAAAVVGNPDDLDHATRRFGVWRDRDARPMARFAADMGAAGETPLLVREMQRRVARDPRLAADFVRVLDHDLRPDHLFTAGRAAGALVAALRTHRGRRRQLLRESATLVRDEIRAVAA